MSVIAKDGFVGIATKIDGFIAEFKALQAVSKLGTGSVGFFESIGNLFSVATAGASATTLAFGKLSIAIIGITAAVKIYNKLVNAGTEANQKMEDALSAYKQDTADLESLNNQLETTKQSNWTLEQLQQKLADLKSGADVAIADFQTKVTDAIDVQNKLVSAFAAGNSATGMTNEQIQEV